MKTRKNKKWILVIGIVMLAVVPGVMVAQNYRVRATDACQSDECREAKAKAEEAEGKAVEALDAASLYEKKVKELSAQIGAEESKIQQSEEKIDELKKEIKKTEEDLDKKQEALAEMLVNVHFDNKKEPIKILAGSSSISDLAEKASREEVARQQVSTAAGAVRDAKDKLENDRQEVENLLNEQQEARKTMVATRKEQKAIQAQYEADADAFAQAAKEAREKQRAEELAYREAHPDVFLGGYYATTNFYPHGSRCPQEQDAFVDEWGMYGCECVSYAAWATSWYNKYNVDYTWGNANTWDDRARALGLTVDSNPAPNTVGQTDAGPYGHVFWVESVDDEGVNISEYNGYIQGEFYSRKIYFPAAYSYNYIHF